MMAGMRHEGRRRTIGSRASNLPLPRGGWCGHERDAPGPSKTSKRGRDGGSTAVGRRGKRNTLPATNVAGLLRKDPAEAAVNGIPQYSPRRPFHSLQRHAPQASRSQGVTPLSGGNACARSFRPCTSAQATSPRQSVIHLATVQPRGLRTVEAPCGRSDGLFRSHFPAKHTASALPAPLAWPPDHSSEEMPRRKNPLEEPAGTPTSTPVGPSSAAIQRFRTLHSPSSDGVHRTS